MTQPTLDKIEALRDELTEREDARSAAEEPLTCQFPEGDGVCGDDGTIFHVTQWFTDHRPQEAIDVCTLHVGASMGARLGDAPQPAYRVWLVQETA